MTDTLPAPTPRRVKPPAWQRRGECNHCGYCCQYEGPVQVEVRARPAGKPWDAAYYETRGYKLAPGRARVLAHVSVPCPKYDGEAKRCSIWPDRPQTCRDFPTKPEQIEGTPCSYWFEAQTDDGIVRRGGGGSPNPTAACLPGWEQ